MRELIDKLYECDHCPDSFWATRPAKYCSPRCRTAAHRARQKPTLLQDMVNHKHFDLIKQWNATRQLSTYAEKLILEIYNRAGYDIARMAITAANAQYDNVYTKTETMYQTEETAEAERIAERLAAN